MSTGDKLILVKWVSLAVSFGFAGVRALCHDRVAPWNRHEAPVWLRVLHAASFWLSLGGSILVFVTLALKELWHL